MDFAHAMNGYRYHTKYDHINYLSMDVLQNTGDNMLALIETIANSQELHDTAAHKDGVNVYFDVLGWIFVTYSEPFGYLINLAVSVLAIWIPDLFLRKTTKGSTIANIHIHPWLISFLCSRHSCEAYPLRNSDRIFYHCLGICRVTCPVLWHCT